MAVLGFGPVSSQPISALPGSGVAPTDDTIPPQTTNFDEGFYGADETLSMTDGVTMSPLEDAAVVADATFFRFDGFYDLVIDEETANYQPEWSRGPPTDQFDETGQTTGWTSNNDWVDENEPITDGTFSVPPIFDEEKPFPALLGEIYEDEPVTDGLSASPPEDAPVGTVDDVPPQELGQIYDDVEPLTEGFTKSGLSFPDDETGQTTGQTSNNDWVEEDEPVTDGWLVAPAEDAPVGTVDDVPPQELGQVYDDDEPVTDGWISLVPTDQFDETGQTTGASSNNDWVDEDAPVTDGWLVAPAEDAPVAAIEDTPQPLLGEIYDEIEPVTDGWLQTVPTDQFDETGQTTGRTSNNDWVDELEPVTDGWLQTVPTDRFDETGQTTGQTSNNDWVDEFEPVTDGSFQTVPTDQFDETGQTTGRTSNEDWTPEDEPIVQDWVYFQADETQPVFNDELNDSLLGEIFPDEEPLTDGTFGLPFEDAPPVVPDSVWTCFPADDDLDAPEYPADFFSGFTASPLEDTPEVVTGTPGLWYDLKTKKKRKKLVFPLLDEEKPLPEAIEEAVEAAEEAPEASTIKFRLLGPRGHNTPIPVPTIKSTDFVPVDIDGWKLLIAGVLRSKSIEEAEARHEALRKEITRRAADVLLHEEVQRWKKFAADFHVAREAREKKELAEIKLIYAAWEIIDDAD